LGHYGCYVSVSKSDCIAWEYCDESEMVRKKAVVTNGGTENNILNPQSSQWFGRDSNQLSPEYKSAILPVIRFSAPL
jgi:hypothetical protein